MKKLTQILTIAFVLGISLYACDTKKDPAPVVVPPPATGFTAASVAGAWKLTAGSAAAVGVPNIFDPAGLSATTADGRAAFCTQFSVLTLAAAGTFTETLNGAAYVFAGSPPITQTCAPTSLAGTFAVVAASGALTLTYAGGTPAPRSFVVKTVTATTMTIEITTTVPFTVVTTVTYTKQ